tara:strand:+ start:158 stop:1549 length:1392 start_codon:yes stop_codon:yes gene_type:complete
MNTKVTVYIPNHNYNKYFKQAIDSVVNQTYDNWELILIIDGYNYLSIKTANIYKKKYKNKIKVFTNKKNLGLRKCCNLALANCTGKYILRLDADDFLNKSALINFVNFLEDKKNIDLVYSDYFYVDETGNVIDINVHEKIDRKKSLFNIPAHGACSMIKVETLKKLGGYNSIFDAQDGYELWLKILDKKSIDNINLPLFYYRQHNQSMSQNENRLLEARRKIKRFFTKKKNLLFRLKILAIVGAKNKNNILLKKFNNKNLIDYSLNELKHCKFIDRVIVSTDDNKVISHIKKKFRYNLYKRPKKFSSDFLPDGAVAFDALKYSKRNLKFSPDIVIFINSNTPNVKKEYIQKALDTLVLFESDSVISVYEDLDLHYAPSENGLIKVSKRMHEQLRITRDALFVDNRCIRVSWSKIMTAKNMLGKRIGHIFMKRSESINIKNNYDMWLADKYLKDKNKLKNIENN